MQTVAMVTPIHATEENGRLELFKHTLKSVTLQTSPDFNLVYIVVDDGSTVDVPEFLKKFNDSRIRYLKRTKSSSDLTTASNALNFGIDYCLEKSSDVFTKSEASDLYAVGFLHSDDLLTRDSIRKRLAQLENGFVYTDVARFNEDGRIIRINRGRSYQSKESMLNPVNFFYFNNHTLMWSHHFLQHLKNFVIGKYEQVSIFDSNISYGEDADVSISSVEAAINGNYKVYYVPAVSLLYREHKKSLTEENKNENRRQEQLDRICLKHFGHQFKELRKDVFLEVLFYDFPWTSFTLLPEGIKKDLKPLRDSIQIWYSRNKYPEAVTELENLIEELHK